MALRNQPYLPLYVQDYLTDEKLNECCAATQGVYIKLMCIMHKSKEYGCILLEQKYRQNQSSLLNFASKLSKHLPFDERLIYESLSELIKEGVVVLEEDKISQTRMVKDNSISIKRSKAGKIGGDKNIFAQANSQAKNEANSEYEYICINSLTEDVEISEKTKSDIKMVVAEMYKVWNKENPMYPKDEERDYHALLQFAYRIAEVKGWSKKQVLSEKKFEVLTSWSKISIFIMNDNWLMTKPLSTILTQWQRIFQEMKGLSKSTKLESKRIETDDWFETQNN